MGGRPACLRSGGQCHSPPHHTQAPRWLPLIPKAMLIESFLSFSHLPLPLFPCSALRGPEQHRARAGLPGSPAPRPGLARRGAGHGGVVWRRGEGAGVQGAQRPTLQHGPGPSAGGQATHRTADRQGRTHSLTHTQPDARG